MRLEILYFIVGQARAMNIKYKELCRIVTCLYFMGIADQQIIGIFEDEK